MIVDQSKVKEAEEIAMRIALLILGGFIALGVVFIVSVLSVKAYPVPITVVSLVLYLIGAAIRLGNLLVNRERARPPVLGRDNADSGAMHLPSEIP